MARTRVCRGVGRREGGGKKKRGRGRGGGGAGGRDGFFEGKKKRGRGRDLSIMLSPGRSLSLNPSLPLSSLVSLSSSSNLPPTAPATQACLFLNLNANVCVRACIHY